ncbi:MAG: zinc-binding dehydrogenase [Casimicrobiaceae bacterium]
MPNRQPRQSLQLHSLVRRNGALELSIARAEVPLPAPNEVVVRIEATPINPSDLGLLFGAADLRTMQTSGSGEHRVVTARVPEAALQSMAARLDQSLPVGNEGAGVVVDAGSSPEAQALIGKVVAIFGGPTYLQYRCLDASQCLPLPQGTTPAEGASAFINPLTSLGMVETMRREGHAALVHTAAASNLGQMLNRICLEDGVPLVNIVRSPEQVTLLRGMGAKHVCNSSAATFTGDLTEALATTGATLAFDAIGGGTLAAQILSGMEAALSGSMTEYSRYGTTTHKQVYIYGSLDTTPTVLQRSFGFAWGIGGWLLWPFLQSIGPATVQKLRERVVGQLKTTFASSYTKEISLADVLAPEEIAVYGKRTTGAKYLINPAKPSAA